jgi:predicted ATPase
MPLDIWIACGQCIEHYGAGEPYLPILEALGRLCREPGGQRVRAVLERNAPTWLIQLSALLTGNELEALQRKTAGATQQRMLREFAEALEVLTAEQALVLVLEDLHWGDYSTLELLFFLARRREHARLLVLGTYRPVEVLVREHPLKGVKQELQMHGQCQELALDFLSEAHVAEYLTQRFVPLSPASVGEGWGEGLSPAILRGLARLIHRRTDGNPLFMVNVLDYVVAQELLVEGEGRWALKGGLEAVAGGVPENLQQLIERQIERPSPADQRVLEVASVAGVEFSAAAVAAGLATEGEEVEERCTGLTRRELFLRASGTAEWPDGTVAARYGFRHALYQEVLYDRIPAGRRQRLHQRIGEREEVAYGERARKIAAELAMHFERGREYRKAVQYLQKAGENAIRRSANQEATSLLTRGLELLKTLPDTPERTQQELMLQIALGVPLMLTKGPGAAEVERVYARARELCQQVGETPQLFPVLWGLWGFYLTRAEFQTARELGDQLLTLAQNVQNPALLLQAHQALGQTLYPLGKLVPAGAHLEQSLAFCDPQRDCPYAVSIMLFRVNSLTTAASVLWFLGYPDQALKRSHEALILAQELSYPPSLALALIMAGWQHQFRREGQAAQERAEAVIALSTEQGFAQLLALGTVQRGWALATQEQGEEGIVQMHQGLAAYQSTGAGLFRPFHLALPLEAYQKVGRTEEGLNVLAEALATAHKTGERFYEAELYRLKGELTLQKSQVSSSKFQVQESPKSEVPSLDSEAEECFWKAIEIARRQEAKSLELRAVMSLSRLWQRQGKKKQARKMLAEIYGWFTEGFDTVDLQEAKALLDALI